MPKQRHQSEFYNLREQRLAELDSGFIKINMTHSSKYGRSGIFCITIEDSGEGFEYASKILSDKPETKNKFSGRGIPLIYSLCHTLEYIGCGNKVVAEIHWPQKNVV